MTTEADFEKKFWKTLKSDRTVMLGLAGDDGHERPMTAQVLHDENERGPIWFFTSNDAALTLAVANSHAATLQLVSKGHDLFATVQGELSPDNNRAMVDELWNPFVAAWYEGGKDDPKLALLRFDPDHAQVWLNENNLLAGIKLLLGRDPKRDYADKTAELRL